MPFLLYLRLLQACGSITHFGLTARLKFSNRYLRIDLFLFSVGLQFLHLELLGLLVHPFLTGDLFLGGLQPCLDLGLLKLHVLLLLLGGLLGLLLLLVLEFETAGYDVFVEVEIFGNCP